MCDASYIRHRLNHISRLRSRPAEWSTGVLNVLTRARGRSHLFRKVLLMRTTTRVALALAGSAALIGVTTVPSFAAESPATSPATVTVAAGVLDLTVPTTVPLVGNGAAATAGEVVPGEDATAALTGIAVTDTRAGTEGWESSVLLSVFTADTVKETDGTTAVTFDASGTATYATGDATLNTTGTAPTVTKTAILSTVGLTTATPVQTATAVSGNNSATWGTTLGVTIPEDALADSYEATLTHSVL